MIYSIRKASDWLNLDSPHPKAYKSKDWSEDEPDWLIEFNTLEELNDFLEDLSHAIIMSESEILIYDDYVE